MIPEHSVDSSDATPAPIRHPYDPNERVSSALEDLGGGIVAAQRGELRRIRLPEPKPHNHSEKVARLEDSTIDEDSAKQEAATEEWLALARAALTKTTRQ